MVAVSEDGRSAIERGKAHHVLHAGSKILVIRVRDATIGRTVVERGDVDDPLDVTDGQTSNRVRIQDGEQHVVHADPESEHEQRGDAVGAVPA